MTDEEKNGLPENRLLSLDFFRGLTMFLLIAEGTHLYSLLTDPPFAGTLVGSFFTQFHHHPWNGLRFWDLIQPFFMFIVGVAMPFSFGKRWARGDSWRQTFKHACQRSVVLLILGWALYCIGPGKITFELWNVLAQLSVTYFIAFLFMRKPIKTQLIFTFVLLFISEMLYRLWPLAGFNQPFVPDHNFGSWFDMLVMGKLSGGHWVAINAIPTTAHTMWGVLSGQILCSDRSEKQKIKILVIAGLIGITVGYALDPLTPIIKRICTSSFVIVSGGWCLVALAFSYWLIEVHQIHTVPKFFAFVGLNPIFIYLFMHTGGANWLHQIVKPFVNGIFSWSGDTMRQVANALVVLLGMWYICYWLYKKKIFIKI